MWRAVTGTVAKRRALRLRAAGGFVIAQLPAEASFDGMPSAAIAAGAVDLVLPIADMPAALAHQSHQPAPAHDDPLARQSAIDEAAEAAVNASGRSSAGRAGQHGGNKRSKRRR